MKIIKLNEKEISRLRVDTAVQFVTKAKLKKSPVIIGVFKWGVQAWALTINNKKVPVKPSKNSIFSVRFDELKIN
jgi:phosphotransferase system IIB component